MVGCVGLRGRSRRSRLMREGARERRRTMIWFARRLLTLGLSIIPVPRPQPGCQPGRPGDGKVPAIAWLKYQQEHASPELAERWFSVPMNIAIVTGAISDIV